ncbi:MAG: LysR family transcriptional regulator [Chromatiales bacterium]|nr:LysR family transcriptional regulator [Chromatiales bacterium]
MIDLNDMLIFAKVVDAGSFIGASRNTGIPKSTISRRISNLETQLGTRLLQRTTRKLKLTELGAMFHERCKRVIAEAEEAERTVTLGQQDPQGLLRISAPVEEGVDVLGYLIADYMKQYPKIRVELDLSNRLVDLVEEGYDLAIRAGSLEDSSLIARRLYTGEHLVCASPIYLETMGEPTTPEELLLHPTLLYNTNDRRFLFTFKHGVSGDKQQINFTPQFTANNHLTLRDAAMGSLGIAIMPNNICRQQLANGSLKPILRDWKLCTDGIYIVYPSPRHLTPKVKSFVDFLTANYT